MATDTDLPDAPHDTDADPATADHGRSESQLPTADEPLGEEQVCVARIERYDDAADECTIYPAEATAEELPTTWITAKSGSFVSLESMR
jgi:hypothetical protein